MVSLQKFGQRKPLVIDRHNQVIAGNGTFESMRRLKMEKCFIVRSTLSDNENEAYAIADNKTGDLSEFDFEKLAKTLKHLDGEKVDLSSTGFQPYELEPLLEATWSPPAPNKDGVSSEGKHVIAFTEEEWNHVQSALEYIRGTEHEYDTASDGAALSTFCFRCME